MVHGPICGPQRGRPLTEKQRAILAFIREFIESVGRPPALREIGRAFGIRSTNGVNDHLWALERKGHIQRDAMTARGIRLVKGA